MPKEHSILEDLYKSRAHAQLTLDNIEKAIKQLEDEGKPKPKKKGLPEEELARVSARRKAFLLKKQQQSQK